MNEVDRILSSPASVDIPDIPEICEAPSLHPALPYACGRGLALPPASVVPEVADVAERGSGSGLPPMFRFLRGARGRTGDPNPVLEEDHGDGAVAVGVEGIEEGGGGKAEKLMVLSAIPEAFVSNDGFEAWRDGCREAPYGGGSNGGEDMLRARDVRSRRGLWILGGH